VENYLPCKNLRNKSVNQFTNQSKTKSHGPSNHSGKDLVTSAKRTKSAGVAKISAFLKDLLKSKEFSVNLLLSFIISPHLILKINAAVKSNHASVSIK